jgi:hypothetical protein
MGTDDNAFDQARASLVQSSVRSELDQGRITKGESSSDSSILRSADQVQSFAPL